MDLVLDCLCGEDTNRGISLLKPLGRYVLYGEFCLQSTEAAMDTTVSPTNNPVGTPSAWKISGDKMQKQSPDSSGVLNYAAFEACLQPREITYMAPGTKINRNRKRQIRNYRD